MKIENYEVTADTFTIPGNVKVFDDATSSNSTTDEIEYASNHIHTGGGGISPKPVAISGSLYGSNKNTEYQELSKHFSYEDNKLKKLYWEDDKFYLGIGQGCKKTHNSGRTNFLDYAASFKVLVGQLFSDTQKTGTSGTPLTNDGNLVTFIEEINGTVVSGAADVDISDSLGNAIKIPASKLTTGQTFVLKLVSMIDSGANIFTTEYNYTTLNGTQTKSVQTVTGSGYIKLEAGADTSDITVSNLSSYEVKFRDGYSA